MSYYNTLPFEGSTYLGLLHPGRLYSSKGYPGRHPCSKQEVEVVLQKLTDPLLALVQDLEQICAIARITEPLETLVIEVEEAKVWKVSS